MDKKRVCPEILVVLDHFESGEFPQEILDDARHIVYNAPRPLHGDATYNSLVDLPFIHGRLYAIALRNNDPERLAWIEDENARLDAWRIKFITRQHALRNGLAWYKANRPQLFARIDAADPDHCQMVVSNYVRMVNKQQLGK